MKKFAFVVNPIAGGKNKTQFVNSIGRVFPQAEGYEVKVVYTERGGDTAQMAARLIDEGFEAIVAVGGDGTANEAARAICRTNAAMGIVPYGSGNGLARHLGLPLNPIRALNYVKKAQVCKIDACSINGTPFFCTAGVGFDALISAKFAQSKQRGIAAYITLIAKEIKNYAPHTYQLVVDGGAPIERRAFLITFANASQWGNNGWIAPHADIADGLIDVVIINNFALYKLPAISHKLLAKRIDTLKEAEIIRCRRLVLKRENEDCIHFDGEPAFAGKEIEVINHPQILKVLC